MKDRSRRQDRGGERERTDAGGDARRFTGSSKETHASESGEWRDGYGAYGVGPTDPAESSRRDAADFEQGRGPARTGYGEQGFGSGEAPGPSWGGGPRGGYGGGRPGGTHGMRGGGWAAAGERFEQGRGPRSHGPEGWGGGPGHEHHEGPRRGSGMHRSQRPDEYGSPEDVWARSEFAGRGEFGSMETPGWSGAGSSVVGSRETRHGWEMPGPYSGLGPEGYRRSEEAIRDDVCERLTLHGELDASGITVRVEDGEVMLDGVVDSRRSKRMAEETAESVSGVRDVHNRLRIDESSFDRARMEGRSGRTGR